VAVWGPTDHTVWEEGDDNKEAGHMTNSLCQNGLNAERRNAHVANAKNAEQAYG